MRLIDADKLHYIRKWFEDSEKSEVVVFAKEIDKQKEVEAIPIEFIKQFSDKWCTEENGEKAVIRQLLRDWEENG